MNDPGGSDCDEPGACLSVSPPLANPLILLSYHHSDFHTPILKPPYAVRLATIETLTFAQLFEYLADRSPALSRPCSVSFSTLACSNSRDANEWVAIDMDERVGDSARELNAKFIRFISKENAKHKVKQENTIAKSQSQSHSSAPPPSNPSSSQRSSARVRRSPAKAESPPPSPPPPAEPANINNNAQRPQRASSVYLPSSGLGSFGRISSWSSLARELRVVAVERRKFDPQPESTRSLYKRYLHSAQLFMDRYLIIFGGYQGGEYSLSGNDEVCQDLLVFDILLAKFFQPAVPSIGPRYGHGAAIVDDYLYIINGQHDDIDAQWVSQLQSLPSATPATRGQLWRIALKPIIQACVVTEEAQLPPQPPQPSEPPPASGRRRRARSSDANGEEKKKCDDAGQKELPGQQGEGESQSAANDVSPTLSCASFSSTSSSSIPFLAEISPTAPANPHNPHNPNTSSPNHPAPANPPLIKDKDSLIKRSDPPPSAAVDAPPVYCAHWELCTDALHQAPQYRSNPAHLIAFGVHLISFGGAHSDQDKLFVYHTVKRRWFIHKAEPNAVACSVERPSSDRPILSLPYPVSRMCHTLTPIDSHRILLFGGVHKCQLFQCSHGCPFRPTACRHKNWPGCVCYKEKGSQPEIFLNDTWILTISERPHGLVFSWSFIPNACDSPASTPLLEDYPIPSHRCGHAAIKLGNYVYLSGGEGVYETTVKELASWYRRITASTSRPWLADFKAFDIARSQWVGPPFIRSDRFAARAHHRLIELPAGALLSYGGGCGADENGVGVSGHMFQIIVKQEEIPQRPEKQRKQKRKKPE